MAKVATLVFDAKLQPFIRQALKAAESVKRVEGNTKRLTQALGAAANQAGRTGTKLSSAGRGAGKFAAASANLKSTLTTMVGAGSVLAGFRALLGGVAEEGREAATSLNAMVNAQRTLAQVSKTKGELQKNIQISKRAAVSAGISPAAAAGLQFQKLSFENLSDEDFAAILKTRKLGQDETIISDFMEAVGKLKATPTFGKDVGTGRQVVSALLAAGGPSDVLAQKIGKAAVTSAQQAKSIGSTLPDFLALLSVLATGSASPEEASTSARGLAKVLQKHGFGGEGFLPGLERFQKEDPTGFVEAINANVRASAAAGAIISARGTIKTREAEVGEALLTGREFDKRIAATNIPSFSREELLRQLKSLGEIEAAESPSARRAQEFALLQESFRVASFQSGENALMRQNALMWQRFMFFFAPESQNRRMATAGNYRASGAEIGAAFTSDAERLMVENNKKGLDALTFALNEVNATLQGRSLNLPVRPEMRDLQADDSEGNRSPAKQVHAETQGAQ